MQHTSVFQLIGTPHFHALCLILISAAALETLIAIWAATSRIHWFWRALAVWAGIAILLPIRAHQPALVFTISSPVTIAIICSIRLRTKSADVHPSDPSRTRPVLPRFAIRDLLLTMAIIGLFLTLLINLVPRLGTIHPTEFSLTILAQTAIPTLSWASFTTRRPRAYRISILGVILAVACAIYFVRPGVIYDWALVGVLFEGWSWRFHASQVVATALGELALILHVAIGLAYRESPQELQSPSHRAARGVLFGAATGWVICLAVVYWLMLSLMPLPPPFSTQPTHYDRLIEIGQRMRSLEKAGFPTVDEPERQALIAETNSLAEAANFIPYDLPNDATLHNWNHDRISPAQDARSLARAIDSEAGAALARGDTERACTLSLTNVHLGLMLQRGGTVVEFLIGVAVQSIANHRLIAIRRELSPDQSRRLIAAWQHALEEQEPLSSIIDRDRAIAERAYGWAARLANIVDWSGLPEIYFGADESQLRRDTTVRLLQTDSALRLYQQDHGDSLPTSLADLVPKYLPQIPIDSYSQSPLIYRATNEGFVLYSVGHDKTDDGGKFGNVQTYYGRDALQNLLRGYDYDLETTTRP
jgi:hypothetical protein